MLLPEPVTQLSMLWFPHLYSGNDTLTQGINLVWQGYDKDTSRLQEAKLGN